MPGNTSNKTAKVQKRDAGADSTAPGVEVSAGCAERGRKNSLSAVLPGQPAGASLPEGSGKALYDAFSVCNEASPHPKAFP